MVRVTVRCNIARYPKQFLRTLELNPWPRVSLFNVQLTCGVAHGESTPQGVHELDDLKRHANKAAGLSRVHRAPHQLFVVSAGEQQFQVRSGLRGQAGHIMAARAGDRHIQQHHVNLDALRAKQIDGVGPIGDVESFRSLADAGSAPEPRAAHRRLRPREWWPPAVGLTLRRMGADSSRG